jgi:hypothetical protein
LFETPSLGLFDPMVMPAERLLILIITHMAPKVIDAVIRCVIYVRISLDKAGDAHGIANQFADLDKRALARGWTVVYRLSDNDIGVTRKDPTRPGNCRWVAAPRRAGTRCATTGGGISGGCSGC